MLNSFSDKGYKDNILHVYMAIILIADWVSAAMV